MSSIPYASRSRDQKRVILGTREWEGQGRPDYTSLFSLSPDEARYIAEELWKLAEQIDGKTKKQSVLEQIRKNTEKIVKQAKLEAMG